MAERLEFIADDACKIKDDVELNFGNNADDADPTDGDVAIKYDATNDALLITPRANSVPVQVVGSNLEFPSTTYNTADASYQVVEADITVGATAGSNTAGNPKFIAAAMGNVLGETALTKVANYVAGLIGHYSVTAANSSTYPTGAVLAGIGDTVSDTSVHGVIAYIDGDSGTTIAGAAFKVMCNNSTAASGFHFGLDLQADSHSSYQAVDKDFYLSAPVRLVNDVCFLVGAGAPVDGTTGDNIAGKSSLYFDITNGFVYINTGTKADGTWVKVGTQS